MRCLYIVSQDPISPNYVGGASALYYDQLLALSELGHEIHLWHFADRKARRRFWDFVETERELFEKLCGLCLSMRYYTYNGWDSPFDRLAAKARSCLPPRISVPRWSIYREFQDVVRKVQPEVVWAQHFQAAALGVQQRRIPVVYVHHDWLYRIKSLRNHRRSPRRWRAAEERLVRAASVVISGSRYECTEIAEAGCRRVHYIPVSYEPVVLDLNGWETHPPQVVHLGGMGTTANREGLLAFFSRVWPKLACDGLQLKVIGDTAGASPELREHLSAVECTGFVQRLDSVLRPFDIHVVPWEHATGQRTRIPVAFNYAQVLVTTKAAAACYPEVRDGVNARVVEQLEEMVPVIRGLFEAPAERMRLGLGARRTFESCFTRPALLHRYEVVGESVHTWNRGMGPKSGTTW